MKLNERLLAKFASDYTTAEKEGCLWKKGEVNKGFQKRYFVLRGNMLFYFEKQQDKEPVGVIILENCHIELCTAETSLFAFQIVFGGVGTRKYVLGAETEEGMQSWMTKLTHAGHVCLETIVSDLERRLEELRLKESCISLCEGSNEPPEDEAVLSSSSDSDTNERSEDPGHASSAALPVSPRHALHRSKYMTLPVSKQVNRVSDDKTFNRWSLATSFPELTSELLNHRSSSDNILNFSERTDFLCDDANHSGRHFSMTAFTPPSFSELKNHEEIEDQNLVDLSPVDGGIPFEKTIELSTLADRLKGNRRAKSEKHRTKHAGISGLQRDMKGSFRGLKKSTVIDVTSPEENHDSSFEHLHNLWGATIWTKVREYELQCSKEYDTKI